MQLTQKVEGYKLEAKQVIDATGLAGQKAEVLLVMDCSGSMDALYRSGLVQDTVERALGLALNFDDDGRVPAVAFDSRTIDLVDVTAENIEGYVEREIVRKHSLGGGTRYAPALKAIAKRFGNNGMPGYGLFVTDGNCEDTQAAEKMMRELSELPIFFNFIGVGRESFAFLKKLDNLTGRKVDNAGFSHVQNPKSFSYSDLLAEFPKYLPAARAAGVLK